MDRWLVDADSFHRSLDEKYKASVREIVQDIVANAKNFQVILEVLRWCDLYGKFKESGFRSEDEVWVGCPIKDKIISTSIPVWNKDYNYLTLEFEQFMEVFVKVAPVKFDMVMSGKYS